MFPLPHVTMSSALGVCCPTAQPSLAHMLWVFHVGLEVREEQRFPWRKRIISQTRLQSLPNKTNNGFPVVLLFPKGKKIIHNYMIFCKP